MKKVLFLLFASLLLPLCMQAQTDTIGYDNGSYASSVGINSTTSPIYWGIKFDPDDITGFTSLDALMIYDPSATYAGTYNYVVYQGGTSAPSSQVASGSVSLTGVGDWVTIPLSSPVALNTSQTLWITFSATITYPAACCAFSGNLDGCWISTDGYSWSDLVSAGLEYTWMLRGIVSGSHTYTQYVISASSANNAMGSVDGAGTYNEGRTCTLTALANDGYRFLSWNNGSTDNPLSFTVNADASYTATFASIGTDTLHYDNGIFTTSVGASGNIYWGIRFEPSDLDHRPYLNGVMLFNKADGSNTLSIYQGTNGPTTQLATQQVATTNDSTWHAYAFSSPVAIDPTLPLWIVFHNNTIDYPATASKYAGSEHSALVSTDGTLWMSLLEASSGRLANSWMIRALLPVEESRYTITVATNNPEWGTVSGGGEFTEGARTTLIASPYYGCSFQQWDDGVAENPRTITVTGDASFTAIFSNDIGIATAAEPTFTATAEGDAIVVRSAAHATLTVYDVLGRQVLSLLTEDERTVVHVAETGVYLVKVGPAPAQRVVVIN